MAFDQAVWAGWVACAAAQRGGDADVAGQAKDADGQFADGGHDVRAGAGAGLGEVFPVGDVAQWNWFSIFW
jgi:hypothetical protein